MSAAPIQPVEARDVPPAWLRPDEEGRPVLSSPLRRMPPGADDLTSRLVLAQRRLYRAVSVAEGVEAYLTAPTMEVMEIEPGDVLPALEVIVEEIGEALVMLRAATQQSQQPAGGQS